MKPAKKIFRLLGGKIKFELALQPSTASTDQGDLRIPENLTIKFLQNQYNIYSCSLQLSSTFMSIGKLKIF